MANKYRTRKKINRDKAKRLAKCNELIERTIDYGCVVDVDAFCKAYKKSLLGVRWKNGVQLYMLNPLRNINSFMQEYKNDSYHVTPNLVRETIYERGKKRFIVPIKIEMRIIEHIICDEVLLKLFTPKLIYANGASLKGKGTDFSRELMDEYINNAVRDGYEYAFQFDVKSYFDSIPHEQIYKIMKAHVKDKRLLRLIMEIVISYRLGNYQIAFNTGEITEEEFEECKRKVERFEDKGVCLGSQISQIVALVVLNDLDHYIKDDLRMKYYIRYMDDGIIFCKTKEETNFLKTLVIKEISKTGLTLSEKKTKIVKLSKGFTFLKVNYKVVNGRKVIRTLARTSVIRMRRKLKKMARLVAEGKITENDVFNSMQSWWSHSFIAKAYHERLKMLEIYKKYYTYKVDFFEERLEKFPTKKKKKPNKVISMNPTIEMAA